MRTTGHFMFGAQLYARCPCELRSPRVPAGSSMVIGIAAPHHQGQAPAPIPSATPYSA